MKHMDSAWDKMLKESFNVPFGLLSGLPNVAVLCGMTEQRALLYMMQRGWYDAPIFNDYRCLLKHPSGWAIRLGLEMDESTGEMVVMYVDSYDVDHSS